MSNTPRWLWLLAACALAGCNGRSVFGLMGGGGSTGGPVGPVDYFTATIDGHLWAADTMRLTVSGGLSMQSALKIDGGRQTGGGDLEQVILELGYLDGPRLYPLGVNPATTAGGQGTVWDQKKGFFGAWVTDLDGAAGALRVTSMTAQRITASFDFIAPAQQGSSATNTVAVTGNFDVQLPSLFDPPTADDYGSSVSATIDGEPWIGATVSGAGDPSQGSLSFGGMTTDLSLGFVTAAPVQVGSTYDQASIRLTAAGGGASWGDGVGDVSSVTITKLEGRRIAGTFTATLPPVTGAAAPLAIAAGAFDVRIDPAP